ncbi:hypothetical protein Vadar_012178 [Vaccinium darrowii]|uniref:Uncharacterized protein n=1 Tax=Vaccinium darrowii TaxID=229202 RepID=A0ACB7YVX6_9ERIC|nr:hypothetical protein Vadar_012178 [Vaccinium darrowii]
MAMFTGRPALRLEKRLKRRQCWVLVALRLSLTPSLLYFAALLSGQQNYHVRMSKYSHAANVASMFTGELKTHVRDAFPTFSKRRLLSASLSAHHVIGHLRILHVANFS